ncbi:hypothetical protein [Kitasatospora sp. NPDC088548]|uniref:hypothetical protein n=1 Tax=Kitasatospora sp. NPDC088548 TaxID=3364075 RepID=UPI00382657D6
MNASAGLRDFGQAAAAVLDRLASDRRLLGRLVAEIEHDPERLEASRVTLLLNRLSLYRANERGFEIRVNMNPRHANQLVPHDHAYNFAVHVLAGGYVHVMRRRTDSWTGEFTSADLVPSVVTVERPGSTYTLGHPMVHQAVMLPGTVSLFLRGPRLKTRSHAATDLLPGRDTWPAPAESGAVPVHSRPASRDEYMAMRSQLVRQGLIG